MEFFGCRLCPLKHDLCINCQKLGEDKTDYDADDLLEYRSMCPRGFGCRSLVPDKYPKFTEKDKTYEAFGKRLAFDRDDIIFIDDNNKEETSNSLQIIGHVIYPGSHLDYRCLADMWLYYRSTEQLLIKNFGQILNPIYSLGIYEIYSLYLNAVPAFNYFLSNKCKRLNFIYPNGDEFVISKNNENNLTLHFFEKDNTNSRYDLTNLTQIDTDEVQEIIFIAVE
jgi:hypothetical protein